MPSSYCSYPFLPSTGAGHGVLMEVGGFQGWERFFPGGGWMSRCICGRRHCRSAWLTLNRNWQLWSRSRKLSRDLSKEKTVPVRRFQSKYCPLIWSETADLNICHVICVENLGKTVPSPSQSFPIACLKQAWWYCGGGQPCSGIQ